jgi:hypothetical protein
LSFRFAKTQGITGSRHPAGPAGQWRPRHFPALWFILRKIRAVSWLIFFNNSGSGA